MFNLAENNNLKICDMKNIGIIRVNLQESIMFIEKSISRVDSVIAMYSSHTNTIKIRSTFWNFNKDIEAYFKSVLNIDKAPIITSCDGFGVEII